MRFRKSSYAGKSVRHTGLIKYVNVVDGAGVTSPVPGVVGERFIASNRRAMLLSSRAVVGLAGAVED